MVGSSPDPHRRLGIQFGIGFAIGVILVSMLALLVMALSLAVGGTLLVIIETGFGGSSVLVAVLLIAALLAILTTTALAGRFLLGNLLPTLRAWGPSGAGGWLAVAAGAVLGLGLGVWVLPQPVASSALQFATGQTAHQRAAGPAAQRELQDLLAAHPDGPEAALIQAVNGGPAAGYPAGRLLTGDDLQARIAALRLVLPDVPDGWQPVVLGTIAELQRGHLGGPPAPGPMDDALLEAGRAGSHAFLVMAAQRQEEIAHRLEGGNAGAAADAAWQNALQAYAAAGTVFEVARLRDETLPERLRMQPLPVAPLVPRPAVDSDLSQRLWQLAQALGDDARWDLARPGERDLAMVAALLALERAAQVSSMARANPAQRWADSPWALGRWILTLRHARGDCLAALELADATRQRRRPAVVNESQPGASPLDLAWAMAWTEAAQACTRTDADRARVRESLQRLDSLRFEPGVLEAARTGVAASVAALR